MWEQFNRYYLTKQIDSKSSRSIYLAHHVNNGSQKVTLEIFDAACFTLDQHSENIFQKIEMIKQLRHSSIVPILDLGVEQGRPYVVRQYHTYDSLHHHLDRLSPQRLNVQEALSIILQVGQGLSYAHQHQILHGSIKPETIFFKSNGEVLLSDFGLASFIDMTKLPHKSDPRTISYMAPEQFVGSPTEKSDQYALACLAYELITGYVPFSAQSTFSVTIPISVEEVSGEAIKRGESEDRDQRVLAHAGSFCENSQCPDYGKVGKNNIHKYGKTRKGEQRWQCKTCQTTWSSSSMWAKQHPELLIPPADLVPDLPEPIQKAVLNAIAKDPSDRYSTVSLFLEALETASLSATAVISNSSLMAPSFSTRLNEAPSTTRLAERSEHGYNGYDSSKALVTLAEDTSLGSRLSRTGKSLTPTLWLAFALSGVVLLLGTMILYVFMPLRSPGSSNPVKGRPTIPIGATPIIPAHHSQTPILSTPVSQPYNSHGSSGNMLNHSDWTASASSLNDQPSNALDGDPETDWSTGHSQTIGEWFLVDMGSIGSFSSITLDAGSHHNNYPRGYQVFVSPDGSTWGNAIASGNGGGALVTISFATQSARYIKVVLTANTDNWWSIGEFTVSGASGILNRSGWIALASSSNLAPSNALDGNPDTHWSTRQSQTVGEWFLVDMGSIHTFSSIILDAGSQHSDYPRGYQVFVSPDGSTWGNAIASGNGNGPLVTISFATQSARYIKVMLTANADNWWSISEFNVY